MQQKELNLPWYAQARLVSPRGPPFDGPLIECLRRWDRLMSVDRARAFIVIDKDGRALTPIELGRIVTTPEYLYL